MRDPPIEPMEDLGRAVLATGMSSFDRQRLDAFENLADRLSGLDAHRDGPLTNIEAGSLSTVTGSLRSAMLRRMGDAAKKFAERDSNGGK